MEENKLIKFEIGALQKVSKAIAITDKLLKINFDYLKWWKDLDENLKNKLNSKIHLESSKIKFRRAIDKKENTQNESDIIKFDEEYKENKYRSIASIKYIFPLKKL